MLLRGDGRMGDESQIAGSARRSPPDSFHQLRGFLSASVIKAFLRSAFGDTFTDGSSPETAIKEYLIDINSSTTKQLVQFLQTRHRSCDLLHAIAKLMQQVKSPSSDSSVLLWPRQLNNTYLLVFFYPPQKRINFIFREMRLARPHQDISQSPSERPGPICIPSLTLLRFCPHCEHNFMLPSHSPVRACICNDAERQMQKAEMEC